MTTGAAGRAAKSGAALGVEPEDTTAAPQTDAEDARLREQEDRILTLERQLEDERRARLQVEAARETEQSRFAAFAQVSAPATIPERTAAGALKPADEGGIFVREDAFKTWRIIARNPNYVGETEGFGFSGGESVATGLPASASDERVRVRLLRLNGLRNYDFHYRTRDARGRPVTRVEPGYRVLTEAQYDAEYADRIDAGEELPEDL